MIATFAWGIDSGVIACVVAAAVVAGVVEPQSGLIFAATVALPAWALAAFATLKDIRLRGRAQPATTPQRASLGAIVMTAAGLGMAISAGSLIALILVYGGYDKGVAAFADLLQPTVQDAMGGPLSLPEDLTPEDVARLVVKYAPAAISASTTLMFLINLYAAGRCAQLSQRLTRPWLDLPTSLTLPAPLIAVALIAVAAWFGAPEPASQFAAVFVGALGVIYVVQGLATLHALSRRAPGRPALIAALYLACLVAPRWILPAIAVIGMIESLAALRARAAIRPFRT
jgi:hypothetical protein